MAVAAHRCCPARRPVARGWGRGHRLRHRLCRTGPYLSQIAVAVARPKWSWRGGSREDSGSAARSRQTAGGGDKCRPGHNRFYPDRSRPNPAAACEGRLCLCRRRPARPCRQLFRGGFEPAGTGSGSRRKRVPQPICRLGPRRSPGSADFAARRKAVSVARRRDAPGRPRRAQLRRSCGWSKYREKLRRKDRFDGDPHRTPDNTDRSRRPGLASLRGAAARPVRLCRRRLGGEIRSRPFRRSHRAGRNLGRGCRQRSASDTDRPRRPRSRDPRSAAGADTTRGFSRSAGLGGRGGNPVHAAGRDRSDPELAVDRRVAQRDPRRCFGGCCVRELVAPLQTCATADRPGLSLGGNDARLPRGLAAELSADRGPAAPNPRRVLAIHVAALCRRTGCPPRKTQARRPGADHDDHVLRHPRVHEPVGKA